MNRDVMISIKGMHFEVTEEEGNIEVIQPGHYTRRGDMHYITYEEPLEGTDAVVKNMIKCDENSMSITKKGPVNTTMLFDTAKKNLTNYATPYGNLIIGLDTHSIKIDEDTDSLNMNIKYSLDINYEFLADCDINITVKNALDNF